MGCIKCQKISRKKEEQNAKFQLHPRSFLAFSHDPHIIQTVPTLPTHPHLAPRFKANLVRLIGSVVPDSDYFLGTARFNQWIYPEVVIIITKFKYFEGQGVGSVLRGSAVFQCLVLLSLIHHLVHVTLKETLLHLLLRRICYSYSWIVIRGSFTKLYGENIHIYQYNNS